MKKVKNGKYSSKEVSGEGTRRKEGKPNRIKLVIACVLSSAYAYYRSICRGGFCTFLLAK